MFLVLLPQKVQLTQKQRQLKQENCSNIKDKIIMASSAQIKVTKGKQNLQNFTTPNEANCERDLPPDTTIRTIEFDDFATNGSLMEFLKQELKCGAAGDFSNGHENDIDTESIFEEVSRMADNSDTRTVEELLREAEWLLEHHNFKEYSAKKGKVLTSTGAEKSQPHTAMQNISKGTDVVNNTKPLKLPNGTTEISHTCRTPTPTTPAKGINNSFCAFVDNMPSESVISEESVPLDLQANTSSMKSSSSSNNTTGKDITTKQMDEYDSDDGADTIEEITEAIETFVISEEVNDVDAKNVNINENGDGRSDDKHSHEKPTLFLEKDSINLRIPISISPECSNLLQNKQHERKIASEIALGRRPSYDVTANKLNSLSRAQLQQEQQHLQKLKKKLAFSSPNLLTIPLQRSVPTLPSEPRSTGGCNVRRSSLSTPDSGVSSKSYIATTTASSITPNCSVSTACPTSPSVKSIGIGTMKHNYCDKSVNSPKVYMVSTLCSPIETHDSISSITREHALKQDIELLQERLKDTEERLESFRIQHDSLSQIQRNLRETNMQLQEESEVLKLDIQHLNECANVLRTELQSARRDRDEALNLQKLLQNELEEARTEKKCAQEQKDNDAKTIQDLQRQCREMERILLRKHPDSVSALIVASKSNLGLLGDQDNHNSRKLLEQRIAQLEADAKEQDCKAQKILANVQARFNSVQAKYETHIADLETQVLSLQEINTKLNEKIESQVRTLDYFVSKKAENFYNNSTQTEQTHLAVEPASTAVQRVATTQPRYTHNRRAIGIQTQWVTKDSGTNTIGSATKRSASSSTSSTANSTPNNSRPSSKQSGACKSTLSSTTLSKLPVSNTDLAMSLSTSQMHINAREDAQLLATVRAMRVDLAIKNKALQRLSRELDDCKKTIRKIQKEKEGSKQEANTGTLVHTSSSKHTVPHFPANADSQTLKQAENKYKLLEADYKLLHEKRLQDLKTLQTAHERELAAFQETVQVLQQRLNERDEQFALQKRRKVPVDYYALKAKVTSLERRHTEREERLHMLVEALSKGRFNGTLDDILADNNNK